MTLHNKHIKDKDTRANLIEKISREKGCDAVLRIKNGEIKKITSPLSGFGKQTITWQDGKITHSEISFTEK